MGPRNHFASVLTEAKPEKMANLGWVNSWGRSLSLPGTSFSLPLPKGALEGRLSCRVDLPTRGIFVPVRKVCEEEEVEGMTCSVQVKVAPVLARAGLWEKGSYEFNT